MGTIDFSGYADFEWAVQLNRFSLKLVGLWPEKAANSQEKFSSNLRLFVAVVTITSVGTVPSLYTLVKIWGNVTAMIGTMIYTVPLLMITITHLILWWKRETLILLMTMIVHDWIKPKSNEERNVMIHYARIARLIISWTYVIAMTTLILMYTISGLGYSLIYISNITESSRVLPMQAHYIYDTSASPQFEITFCLQCLTFLIVGLVYVSSNNFLGLLIFHICGQLENLTARLYRMNESGDFLTTLRINVVDHIRLTRSVAIIEDTFALMLFLLFFYFGGMFCVYEFLIVTRIVEGKNTSIKEISFLILTVCTAIINTGIYCAVGELLMIKTLIEIIRYILMPNIYNTHCAKYEKVYNAVYECKWYTLETKQAKNFILLLMRMNKPLYITVGKLLPMKMSTFCDILKTSAGYMSVLLANRT